MTPDKKICGPRGPYKPRATGPTKPVQQIRIPITWSEEIERRGGLRQVLIVALQIDEPQAMEKEIEK